LHHLLAASLGNIPRSAKQINEIRNEGRQQQREDEKTGKADLPPAPGKPDEQGRDQIGNRDNEQD
jgi:hypothetical protein